jgi:beta-lactamase class C
MRTTMSRRSALALIGAGAWTGAARAEPNSLADVVERAFRPLLARHDVPGIAVGLTVAGRRSFFAFGSASRGSGATITDDTLFELGSISKVFAATLAARAAAVGTLSLDMRVDSLVSELRHTAIGRATLLHLTTYTAGGLPLQFPDGIESDEAALAYFKRWTPLATPGAIRRYSNPSVVLLAMAVGRALKSSPAEAIENLMPALGLRRSAVRVPTSEMDRYAQGYDKGGHPIRLRPTPFPAAAYGVKATTADMLAFLEANLVPGRLASPLRGAAEDTQRGHFRVGPMVQGLGWEIYPEPVPLDRLLAGNSTDMAMQPHRAERLDTPPPRERSLLNKTGSTNGFGAYVVLMPSKAAGLVMLANGSLPIPARVTAAHAVLEAATKG